MQKGEEEEKKKTVFGDWCNVAPGVTQTANQRACKKLKKKKKKAGILIQIFFCRAELHSQGAEDGRERKKSEKTLNPELEWAHASCATSKPDTYYISLMSLIMQVKDAISERYKLP